MKKPKNLSSDVDAYQDWTKATALMKSEDASDQERLIYAAIGLADEAIEALDKIVGLVMCDCDVHHPDCLQYLIDELSSQGRLLGRVKKEIRTRKRQIKLSGEPFGTTDKKVLVKELGDVAWYLARCADECGYRLSTVLEGNVRKIESRRERGTQEGSGDDR